MKYTFYTSLITLLFIISACQKDNQTIEQQNVPVGYVIANDSITEGYIYKEYNDTIPESLNNTESKSIDIDGDSEFDYKLTYSFSHSVTGSYWTSFAIYSLNGNAGFTADTSNEYVAKLNGDTINANYYWKNTSSYISSYSYITVPPNAGSHTTSNWTQAVDYIGIRIKKNGIYKYGWIKTNRNSHVIISSLIKK